MLNDAINAQLKGYFEKIREPVEFVAALGDDPASTGTRELLDEIASLSDRITVIPDDADERKPSFAVRRKGGEARLRFAGLPMGHEFNSLILAILQVGSHPPKTASDLVEQVKALDGDYRLETYFSQSCQNCPEVVQALNRLSVLNHGVALSRSMARPFPQRLKRGK